MFVVSFYWLVEYRVCVCAASLVEKEISKETEWSYGRVEKAARIVGRVRDSIHRRLAKVFFAIGGNKLWSHCEFCVSGDFLGRDVRVSINAAQR